jgi:polar amino acid transport system substrate-binding protein
MKQPSSKRRRLALAGLVLTLASAGCGTVSAGENGEQNPTGTIAFSPQIHERLPEAVRRSGLLRFATDPSYAPMESYAADGRTIIGFDPDLAAALGAVAGVKVEMVAADFGTVIERTVDGTYDGVLSSMTDTRPAATGRSRSAPSRPTRTRSCRSAPGGPWRY